MPRDPKLTALARVQVTADTVAKCRTQLAAAQWAYRNALLIASERGVRRVELAQRCATSESRIRQHIERARAESEIKG